MLEPRQIVIDTVLASISMLVSSTYIRGKGLLEHRESYGQWCRKPFFLKKKKKERKAINITPFIGLISLLTVRATVRSLRQGRKCTIIKLSKAGMTVG